MPEQKKQEKRSLSMHENVPLWCDVCCCEPEPRWQALEDELQRAEAEAARQARDTQGRQEDYE